MNLTPVQLSASRILALSDRWRQDAHELDLDRAELIRHYNGGALDNSDEDDPYLGKNRQRRANMLLGYKFLSRPAEQLLAVYDEGIGFLDVTVNNPGIQPSRRQVVQNHINREINQVIQKSERMYWPWRSVIGDAVINGIGCLYRDDRYDWAPKYGRPYFSWDAPADITDDGFSDWCFLGNLKLGNIITRLERLKTVSPEDSYWDKERLVAVAEALAKRHIGENNPFQPLHHDDPITWREWVQTQSWGDEALSAQCPVVWFYAKRYDSTESNKRPVDLYCVPRWGEVTQEINGKLDIARNGKGDIDGVLFHHPNAFEDVRECLFPYLLSCMIGGEALLRRTMGLGVLMYDLDVRVQSSINNMFDAQDFDFSPLFQATDSQSEMELQDLAGSRIRPYDIMPSGARFMEKPKGNRPYSSVFELTQLMSNEMGNQAQSFHGGEGFENKGRAELEVQVLERRQQLTTALRLRMADFIRRGDPMATAIGHTIVNEDSLLPVDPSWPVREALKERLKQCGVEWDEVHGYCTFAIRRTPGHGDPGLALSRAQQTEMISRGLGPKAHRMAQRNLISAVNGGDTRLAMEMVPDEDPKAGEQEQQALAQSAMCITTGMPSPVIETDNPMAHVPVHMAVLTNYLAMAREGGNRWTRMSQRGWEALAAHTTLDIQILGAFDPNRAKEAEKALKSMVQAASQIEVAGLPGQADPVEQARLQLQMQEQQRKDVKTQDDIAHRRATQEHREEVAAFQQNLQMAQLVENERSGQVNRSTKLAKTASDIAQPPASTSEG